MDIGAGLAARKIRRARKAVYARSRRKRTDLKAARLMSRASGAPALPKDIMPASPDDLFAFLDRHAITATTTDHAAVFTVEESRHLRGTIPGAHTKNLFLRDNKRRLFLVTLDEERAVDLKALRPLIGAKGGLSFASPEALLEHLGVTPGSVSPLALLNDAAGSVTIVLDRQLLADSAVNLHPLINTKTTSVRPDDLLRFLTETGHDPLLLDFDAQGVDHAEAGDRF